LIEFKEISKSFGEKKVLKSISFVVPEGKILFILGTSGTGKSVLLKSLVGLLPVDSGEIWIDGTEISQFDELQFMEVRQKCGMVFQQPALFDSLNIFENIAYGLRRHFKLSEQEMKERVLSALEMVDLKGVESKMPQEISYGMKKRVSLARTVVLKPKILLFDEPTTGLDPVTTRSINLLIQDLSRKLKTTSVVVSHDMICALEIADQIMVLDQGGILEQGTPAQLKKSSNQLTQDFLKEVHFD
jgi:phospholipid/cholesterol/gamma-HCH transport system ATP-binding protein